MYLLHTSPALVQTLDELVRADFQHSRDSCFWWLIVSAGVVALGVILEGPEVIHEFGLFRRGSEAQHPTTGWIKLFGLLGWLLIAIGVAGEGVAEALVSKTDGILETFNDILLVHAQKEVGIAMAQSGTAYERASNSEREAAQYARMLRPSGLNV